MSNAPLPGARKSGEIADPGNDAKDAGIGQERVANPVRGIPITPCPFCGDGDPAIDEVELRVWAVVCNGCGCAGPIENYEAAQQTAERAIELWNGRPMPGGDS